MEKSYLSREECLEIEQLVFEQKFVNFLEAYYPNLYETLIFDFYVKNSYLGLKYKVFIGFNSFGHYLTFRFLFEDKQISIEMPSIYDLSTNGRKAEGAKIVITGLTGIDYETFSKL